MWIRFLRIGRSWAEPKLATTEFFYFQVAFGAFVFLLNLLFPWSETVPTVNAIHVFFSVISVLMNIAYVSLAFGIRVKLPLKIYIALAADVLVAALPIWSN